MSGPGCPNPWTWARGNRPATQPLPARHHSPSIELQRDDIDGLSCGIANRRALMKLFSKRQRSKIRWSLEELTTEQQTKNSPLSRRLICRRKRCSGVKPNPSGTPTSWTQTEAAKAVPKNSSTLQRSSVAVHPPHPRASRPGCFFEETYITAGASSGLTVRRRYYSSRLMSC